MNIFFKSILSGVLIGLGGTANLLVGGLTGSVLFSMGLVSISYLKIPLFTGRIGYLEGVTFIKAVHLLFMLLGNLVGANIIAQFLLLTQLQQNIIEAATKVVNLKLENDLLGIFILAVMCGVLVYTAVESFRKTNNIIALMLPVVCFSICGFEHCIAFMFYFSASKYCELSSISALSAMIFGNSIGAIVTHRINSTK